MSKIINKSIIIIGIIMLLSSFTLFAMAGNTPKFIIDGPVVVAPDEDVTFTIAIEGNDIIGAQADIYIDKLFFDIISIENAANEEWNISHSSADTISILGYSSDLSSMDNINLVHIKVKAKGYILKGDRITMTVLNPKIVSREYADTLTYNNDKSYIYVGETVDKRGWDSQKQYIKSASETTLEFFMYGDDEIPKWLLNTAIKNNLTIKSHMAGYDFVINPAQLIADSIKNDSYNMKVNLDYNAHKYADNQLAVIYFEGESNFPGTVSYSIFIPSSTQSDENTSNILIYQVNTANNKYELLGEYEADDKQNINLEISEFGTYIAATSEIEGDLLLPYQTPEKEIEPETKVEEIGYGLAVIGIILAIIALFWFSAIMAVRAIRRKLYRTKINKRTLELILDDEEDINRNILEKSDVDDCSDIEIEENDNENFDDDITETDDDEEIDESEIDIITDNVKKKKRKLFKKHKH